MRATIIACTLTVLLSGCNVVGLGTSGPRAYAPDDGRPVIVCLGDSLTAGDAAPADQSYPAWLQRRLDARGYRYRVINAGVSGNRVADGLQRLDSDVLSFHPAIVVVALGSNDPGHVPAETWAAQLGQITGTLAAHRIRVVLAGLDEPGMRNIYRSVAARAAVPLVWLTNGLWSRPGLWGDQHHPNGRGYRVVMENVWSGLVTYLRRS